MALVRCEYHGKPKGRTFIYVKFVEPVGGPESAAICGLKDCERAGLIWLNDFESRLYDKGQRVFSLKTATIKVRAK